MALMRHPCPTATVARWALVTQNPASALERLGRCRGCYLLGMHIYEALDVHLGRRGSHRLPSGFYIYVGSAMGRGGLKARLGRHLATKKRIHWHVDHITSRLPVTEIAWLVQEISTEHQFAAHLCTLSWIQTPIPGFGSSDCHCSAHLFRMSRCHGTPRSRLNAVVASLEPSPSFHSE